MTPVKYFSAILILGLSACGNASEPQQAVESQTMAAASAADVTPVVQKSCQDEAYRDFDFWVGDWDLTWTNADGSKGQGRNIITRTPFGDCVITENFDGGAAMAFKGMSVSTYSKPHKLWRQTWVDDQGGYYALYGGPQKDGTFILDMERLGDKGPYSRMVFEDITDNGLVWRWQGKRAEGDEWTDQWVINYERR